jgi:hypothetical protein
MNKEGVLMMSNNTIFLWIKCITFIRNLLNFLNGLAQHPFLELSIINFGDIKIKDLMLVKEQYRAWTDCTCVDQPGSIFVTKPYH